MSPKSANMKLKAAIELACSVKVYVPSTTDVDVVTDTQEWVDHFLKLLSEEFGGATSTPALGAWISDTGALVKEDVTIVFAYCTQDDLQKNIGAVIEGAELMKSDLHQEAIAVEINNKLYLL